MPIVFADGDQDYMEKLNSIAAASEAATEAAEDAVAAVATAVRFEAQTLTAEQKEQVRENIGVSELRSVKDFGAVGDGVTNDTAAIQAAINTGFNVAFPTGTYMAAGLTGTTAEQKFYGLGAVRIKKNGNGILLSHSGRDVEFNGILFDGDSSNYSGHNVVTSGDHPRFINCGSRDASGLALWAQGNGCEIHGTNQLWQTANSTGAGYDIQCGAAGTTTLYHYLEGIYTSQATGGINLIDTGSHTIVGGQFGKLNIQNTGAAAVNGGKTIGARILGNVNINSSSAVFSGNQFGAVTISIGDIDALTSGCVLDRSNVYQVGCAITNSGNANNIIERQISAGSYTQIRYGDDASLANEKITPTTGEKQWSGALAVGGLITAVNGVGIDIGLGSIIKRDGGTGRVTLSNAFDVNGNIRSAAEFRMTYGYVYGWGADGDYNSYVTAPSSGQLQMRGGSGYIDLSNSGAAVTGAVTASTTLKSASYAAGALPSAATAGAGARAFVSDASATTFLSVVAGGGANKVPVVSDGANWLIG